MGPGRAHDVVLEGHRDAAHRGRRPRIHRDHMGVRRITPLSNMPIMPSARTPAASGYVMTLLCILGLVAGCSSLGPDPSLSGSTARRFHEALANNEPAVACDLLAPATRDELEQSAKTSCPQALADAGLPDAAAVASVDVYGLNARVVLDGNPGDTVFLARFGTQWKVTGAGCKARQDLPYDCDVKSD